MRTKNEMEEDVSSEKAEAPFGEDEDIKIIARHPDELHCPVCGSKASEIIRPPGDPETFFFACKFCLCETFVRFPLDLVGDPEPRI